jgi:hypothetical protein
MNMPSRLSDRELEAEVIRLARCERSSTASLVAHLAELYGRRLHERAGFSSLFTYCMQVLRPSGHEAYDRMKAAKVARRYPAILGSLASGEINLTTIRLLAPHLAPDNQEDLLAAARGKRKRQVQELLASRFPEPDVPFSIRKRPSPPVALPLPRPLPMPTPIDAPSATATGGTPTAVVVSTTGAPMRIPIPGPPPPLVHPLAPDRYRVTFTANTESREMLELAQDLLRHAIPTGDPALIFARALEVLIEGLLKRKFAMTRHPHAGRPAVKDSRNPTAKVMRAVYIRDRGRCTFVGTDGRKCGERAFLEFDHCPIPFAAGGRATVDNLQLRCRTHNQYLAEQFFGRRVRDETVPSSPTAKRRAGLETGAPRPDVGAHRPASA